MTSVIANKKSWLIGRVLFFLLFVILCESFSVYQFRISRFGVEGTSIDSFPIFFVMSLIVAVFIFFSVYFALLKPSKNFGLYLPILFFVLLAISGIVDIWYKNSVFLSYGDAGELRDSVGSIEQVANPRWVFGVYVLSLFRWSIESFIVSIDAQRFIETMGTLLILATSVFFLIRSKARTAYIFPLFVPMWLTFGTGYDEYQPFIAPIAIFVLLRIFDEHFEQPALPEVVIVGLLPAIYVGFLPLSILYFAISLWSKDIKSNMKNLFFSIAIYLLAIEISWPLGNRNYFASVIPSLQLGVDTHGGVSGQPSSSRSIFFGLKSVLSSSHLEGLGYMLLLGGGVFGAILALFGLARLENFALPRAGLFSVGLKKIGVVQRVCLVWFSFYIFFLMAKLGPTGDIDAFYATFFVFAITLGLWIDGLSNQLQWTAKTKAIIAGIICSLNAPMFVGLGLLGTNRTCDIYSLYRSFC